MTEISWGFFSRRQKVIIPLYLMSFGVFINSILIFILFFVITNGIFSKVKNPKQKLLASQQRLAPPGGGGRGHMVPYGTIWYHMVPYGTIWYHMVPYGTIWYHMVPYGTLWYHKVPYGTIRYLMVP